jgi:hypothetical protein
MQSLPPQGTAPPPPPPSPPPPPPPPPFPLHFLFIRTESISGCLPKSLGQRLRIEDSTVNILAVPFWPPTYSTL